MNNKLKTADGSYIHNNLIIARKGDGKLFTLSGETVSCRLNGYAIIPVEKYYKLTGEVIPENLMNKINETRTLLLEEDNKDD